jgi:hypothetical protein
MLVEQLLKDISADERYSEGRRTGTAAWDLCTSRMWRAYD